MSRSCKDLDNNYENYLRLNLFTELNPSCNVFICISLAPINNFAIFNKSSFRKNNYDYIANTKTIIEVNAVRKSIANNVKIIPITIKNEDISNKP